MYMALMHNIIKHMDKVYENTC